MAFPALQWNKTRRKAAGSGPTVYVRADRYDPTRTLTLRKAFMAEVKRRFRKFRKEVKKAILEDDLLGLKNPPKEAMPKAAIRVHAPFDFPTSKAKFEEFMKYIEDLINKELLAIEKIERIGESIDERWSDIYIKDSYKRGVQRARYELEKAGYEIPELTDLDKTLDAALSGPFHADRLGLLYTRVYSALKGITDAMEHQISLVLTQAMMDGDNPTRVAKKLLKVISGIGEDLGITDTLGRYISAEARALTLARTEIIRAHHLAMMQEYKNWKLAGVKVMAEWVTAGYNVCPDCAALEGKVFTLQKIENMIPLHPNCRCVAIPVDKTEEEEAKGKVKFTKGKAPPPLERVPDYFDEARKEFDDFVDRLAKRGVVHPNSFFKEYFGGREAARGRLAGMLEDSNPYMSINGDTLLDVIRSDGRFRNAFETGASSFPEVASVRKETEKWLLGVPDDIADSARPKYGFLAGDQMDHRRMLEWHYGDTFIKFDKKRVKDRITITLGDSFQRNKSGFPNSCSPPVKLADPDENFFIGLMKDAQDHPNYMRRFTEAKTVDDLGDAVESYVEAQFHGILTLDDVAEIEVASKRKAEELMEALRKAGYDHIRVVPAKYDQRLVALGGRVSVKVPPWASALRPEDIDKLGDIYIQRLKEQFFDTMKEYLHFKGSKDIPEDLLLFLERAQGGWDPPTGEMRKWLKKMYKHFEDGTLPPEYMATYKPELVGWIDDVWDQALLQADEGLGAEALGKTAEKLGTVTETKAAAKAKKEAEELAKKKAAEEAAKEEAARKAREKAEAAAEEAISKAAEAASDSYGDDALDSLKKAKKAAADAKKAADEALEKLGDSLPADSKVLKELKDTAKRAEDAVTTAQAKVLAKKAESSVRMAEARLEDLEKAVLEAKSSSDLDYIEKVMKDVVRYQNEAEEAAKLAEEVGKRLPGMKAVEDAVKKALEEAERAKKRAVEAVKLKNKAKSALERIAEEKAARRAAEKEAAKKRAAKKNPKLPDLFDESRQSLQEKREEVIKDMAKEGHPPAFEDVDEFYDEVFGGREQAREYVKGLVDDSNPYMAIKGSTLRKMIREDGKFKNSLETGKSTFKTIGEVKAKLERAVFGIVEDDPDAFPKYGFIAGADEMDYEEIVGWGYGDTFVKFNPERVRDRMTITLGDSFDGNTGRRLAPPVSYADPDEDFFLGASIYDRAEYAKRFLGAESITDLAAKTGNYVEAQFYGKLTLDDVDEIFVTSKKEMERLKKALKRAGYEHIKVRPAKFSEPIKFIRKKGYDKGTSYALSILPEEVDLMGPDLMEAIYKRTIRDLAMAFQRGSYKAEEFAPELVPILRKIGADLKYTPTEQELRTWLKTLARAAAEGKLPKIWAKDYKKSLLGWVSDVANPDLLK